MEEAPHHRDEGEGPEGVAGEVEPCHGGGGMAEMVNAAGAGAWPLVDGGEVEVGNVEAEAELHL